MIEVEIELWGIRAMLRDDGQGWSCSDRATKDLLDAELESVQATVADGRWTILAAMEIAKRHDAKVVRVVEPPDSGSPIDGAEY